MIIDEVLALAEEQLNDKLIPLISAESIRIGFIEYSPEDFLPDPLSLNADPLHFNSWPEFLWKQSEVFQPLPTLAVLNDIIKLKNNLIVHYAHRHFSVEDNYSLQMALLLAGKLSVPVIAIVSLLLIHLNFSFYWLT